MWTLKGFGGSTCGPARGCNAVGFYFGLAVCVHCSFFRCTMSLAFSTWWPLAHFWHYTHSFTHILSRAHCMAAQATFWHRDRNFSDPMTLDLCICINKTTTRTLYILLVDTEAPVSCVLLLRMSVSVSCWLRMVHWILGNQCPSQRLLLFWSTVPWNFLFKPVFHLSTLEFAKGRAFQIPTMPSRYPFLLPDPDSKYLASF